MWNRVKAWVHRDCWHEWTHPVTGDRLLYRPDSLTPTVKPQPMGESFLVPEAMAIQYRRPSDIYEPAERR